MSNFNTLNLLDMMRLCSDDIYEIETIIKKKKKTIKYWIKTNIQYIKSYFKRKEDNLVGQEKAFKNLEILMGAINSDGGKLISEYWEILEEHLGNIKNNPEKLSYPEQYKLYVDLYDFRKQLIAIKLFIESDLIDDYANITTK